MIMFKYHPAELLNEQNELGDHEPTQTHLGTPKHTNTTYNITVVNRTTQQRTLIHVVSFLS